MAGQYSKNMCPLFSQNSLFLSNLGGRYFDNVRPIFGQYTLYWPDIVRRDFASN
jgi:hypothetical protein